MRTTTRRAAAAAQEAKRDTALRPDRMYATYDRFVCGRIDCAGSCAVHTGIDIEGRPVRLVTPEDVAEWTVTLGMGDLACSCGRRVALSGLPNPDGSARIR